MEIERNEYGSFKYDDAVPPLGEYFLCEDDPNILELIWKQEVDNIEACGIKWDKEFYRDISDLYNDIEDLDGIQEIFDRIKEGTITQNRQQVSV